MNYARSAGSRLALLALMSMGAALVCQAQFDPGGFEPPNYNGSATGIDLNGQQGWYLPSAGGVSQLVLTYAGNALNFPANPNGGTQFVGIGNNTASALGRSQHAVDFSAGGTWSVGFDFCCNSDGGVPTFDNIASVSLQPSTSAQYFICLQHWTDTNTGTSWEADFIGFDATGAQVTFMAPPAGFHNLTLSHWYHEAASFDFTSHRIVDVRITDLTTNVTSSYQPTDWYLNGGANSTAPLPTDMRLFRGADTNLAGFDNFVVAPVSSEVRVSPSSVNAFRGTIESGGLAQVLTSDDTYLVVKNGVTALRTESPITVDATYTSPTQTVGTMKIRWENRVSITGLVQRIQMRNYNAGGFTEVDSRTAPTTDTVTTITLTNPNDYIESGTKAMISRHRVNPGGPVFTNTWRSFSDEIVILQS